MPAISSDSMVYTHVVVLRICHLKPWTLILVNSVLFLLHFPVAAKGLGNPAADKSVKEYLCMVSSEQLQTCVMPKQATPFLVDKLVQFSLHLGHSPSKVR